MKYANDPIDPSAVPLFMCLSFIIKHFIPNIVQVYYIYVSVVFLSITFSYNICFCQGCFFHCRWIWNPMVDCIYLLSSMDHHQKVCSYRQGYLFEDLFIHVLVLNNYIVGSLQEVHATFKILCSCSIYSQPTYYFNDMLTFLVSSVLLKLNYCPMVLSIRYILC